ncbi:MAG TPA: DUF3616 domain-containing protein [Polyangiales bacterium]|nr:DUF3616 domain-containing protein [Polyangiales bacterium]
MLLPFALGCGAGAQRPDSSSAAAPASQAAAPVGPAQARTRVFHGMCDASGAVVLGAPLFAVADDEDNVLRVYDGDAGGGPLYSVDVSPALDLPAKNKTPEADIEAATRIGDRALWLTSHGRNSKGKLQPGRFRLFATTTPASGVGLTPTGSAYEHLLDDMLASPQLAALGLRAAAELAPKDTGGLNIEGMTERPDGRSVVIGFRNPRPEGRAIVVPIENPLALVQGVGGAEGAQGVERVRAQLGAPWLLDLGGLGVRALSYWRGRYLIIGGPVDGESASALFAWDGASEHPARIDVDLNGLNPEGFVSFDGRAEVMLLSDDGALEIDGEPCKKLPPERKRFRGMWIQLPDSASVEASDVSPPA